MRYAIYLTFDDDTDTALKALRGKLADKILGMPDVKGKMGPHLTLLVFDEENRLRVMDSFREGARSLKAFPLTLNDVDVFPGRRHVLYVRPQASEALQAAFFAFYDAFAFVRLVPHYRKPGQWHPHVTLAKGIARSAAHAAKSMAGREWKPMAAQAVEVGLIDVLKPLEVLAAKALPPG